MNKTDNPMQGFRELSLSTFFDQYRCNEVYRKYVELLGIRVSDIQEISDIPFLPIKYFKTHKILCSEQKAQIIFKSSGTSGQEQSQHFVSDLDVYRESYIKGFEYFYGNSVNYRFLALLPDYLEREGSSLVFMMDDLIRRSQYADSDFYLRNLDALLDVLIRNEKDKIPTILIGVSYALLDLAEIITKPIRELIIMETGGMKGKRPEIPKPAFHQILKKAFGVKEIHSEYGMTELLSQAYSQGDGKFRTPPWMKVIIRDLYDPFRPMPAGRTGGINVIDLANKNSVSFIETQDLGRINSDGTFEVLGRINQSDIRGCNLLLQ
ncbi:MAG: acyl transferase [Bacteroidetes bacterium]|nr:acyl transferase [Bacteroidota bacterium]